MPGQISVTIDDGSKSPITTTTSSSSSPGTSKSPSKKFLPKAFTYHSSPISETSPEQVTAGNSAASPKSPRASTRGQSQSPPSASSKLVSSSYTNLKGEKSKDNLGVRSSPLRHSSTANLDISQDTLPQPISLTKAKIFVVMLYVLESGAVASLLIFTGASKYSLWVMPLIASKLVFFTYLQAVIYLQIGLVISCLQLLIVNAYVLFIFFSKPQAFLDKDKTGGVTTAIILVLYNIFSLFSIMATKDMIQTVQQENKESVARDEKP